MGIIYKTAAPPKTTIAAANQPPPITILPAAIESAFSEDDGWEVELVVELALALGVVGAAVIELEMAEVPGVEPAVVAAIEFLLADASASLDLRASLNCVGQISIRSSIPRKI